MKLKLAARATLVASALLALLPASLALAADTYLLVASSGTGNIMRYDFQTGAMTNFVQTGHGNSTHAALSGFAVGPDGNIYAVLADTAEVRRYNGITGADMGTFAASVPGFAIGIAFDSSGRLYVGSNTYDSITRYSNTGSFIDTFASGSTSGINGPRAESFDILGNLYVTSTSNGKIRKFDTAGVGSDFVTGQGSDDLEGIYITPEGNPLACRYSSGEITKYGGDGLTSSALITGLSHPRGVVSSDFGGVRNYYVSEEGSSSVGIYDSNGNLAGGINFSSLNPSLISFVAIYTIQPKVSGKLFLLDYVGSRPSHVQFEFRDPESGAIVKTYDAAIGSDGSYVSSSPGPGVWDMSAKVGHWLRKTLSVDTLNGDVSGLAFRLINGDCDGDNAVTVFDYSLISDAFDSGPGDARWNADADLDGDGSVNVFDYTILSDNFDMVGDE